MVQPAVPVNENMTDLLGIFPLWAKPSIDQPFLWEPWVGQFVLAVSLKNDIISHDLADPAEI